MAVYKDQLRLPIQNKDKHDATPRAEHIQIHGREVERVLPPEVDERCRLGVTEAHFVGRDGGAPGAAAQGKDHGVRAPEAARTAFVEFESLDDL